MKMSISSYLLLAIVLTSSACATSEHTKSIPVKEKLSSIDKARIDFAKQSMKKVLQNWKLNSTALETTCIVLFGDKHEWILNCPSPLVESMFNVSDDIQNPVFFTSESLSIPGAKVPYEKIASSIVAQANVLTPYLQKEKK